MYTFENMGHTSVPINSRFKSLQPTTTLRREQNVFALQRRQEDRSVGQSISTRVILHDINVCHDGNGRAPARSKRSRSIRVLTDVFAKGESLDRAG
jgi:hypothetical protein